MTVLRPYLRPGEKVLWHGRPDPAVTFAPIDALLVPFSIVWLAFAVFWEASVIESGAPVFFLLFGGVFVLIGLYFVLGRFVYKRRRKAATAYAVTDMRALSVTGQAMADSPARTEPMQVRRARDRSHVSVSLGQSTYPIDYSNTGMDWFGRGQRFGFYDVEDGERMLAALERLRAG
ncbi:hypothetical protein [Naasia aerilata]|uniref:PH domain-containing protein n=1 Tax=Naasia aerilata TaxID=1162966 RepID=A0ABN6XPA8_9MICO|nr:hypothetical protein [Naasia aerilata]BDZ46837.1 hypothetical protein GCM10025866_27460 [Naasia aerilata]